MSEPQIAWAEAFTAVRVIKESIRQCANNGPLAMLEVLGNYINEVDATEDDDIAAFQAAVKRIRADHKDTTEPEPCPHCKGEHWFGNYDHPDHCPVCGGSGLVSSP